MVPLKHGLNYEVLEKGHVRFWLQAVKLSPSVSYRFIVNDKEVTSGEVTSSTSSFRVKLSRCLWSYFQQYGGCYHTALWCHQFQHKSFSQGHHISHDVSTGIIQMTVDHFTRASEGTYTLQIHDGKAKTQSSLVLVGDGEHLPPSIQFFLLSCW